MRRVLLVTVLVTVAALLPAAPAAAQAACQPAGGAATPSADAPAGDFRFTGRGWGHGVGMSQYGARGAAKLGCTAEQILSTYFPRTGVASEAMPERVRVGLWPDRPNGSRPARVDLVAEGGDVRWVHRHPDGATDVADQPSGARFRASVNAAGALRIVRVAGDGSTSDVWSGGRAGERLEVRHDGRRVQLTGPDSAFAKNRHYRHGLMEIRSHKPSSADARLTVVSVLSDVDHYLYGLAEMPWSWEQQALRAQAIAGRSYLVARSPRGAECSCDVYDSVFDQVFAGDLSGRDRFAAWRQAVDGTRGRTLQHDGDTVQAFYASSHGGHSESTRWVWGGENRPYYEAVDDSRWEAASDNPRAAWGVARSAAELASGMERIGRGVGNRVADVTVLDPIGAGGRIGQPSAGAGGVRVRGPNGSQVISGEQARSAFGLNSALFTVRAGADAPPPSCDPPADATVNPAVERVAGTDRIATAVALSERGWPDGGARRAVVAAAADFPDALAGGALAAVHDGPVLLTRGDRLSGAVRDELLRLEVRVVYLLGGHEAVSNTVRTELENAGVTVERIAGEDRFSTAGAVAERVGTSSDGEAVLALGRHPEASRAWPDAVAAAALLAAPDAPPTLLTDPDRLPAATRETLESLDTQRVTIIGGDAAVSAAVEAEVRALGIPEVVRLEGETRYETSIAVASEAQRRLGATPERFLFATAGAFPDALASGGLAARVAAPVVLASDCDLERQAPAVRDFVRDGTSTPRGTVVGGVDAVSERVRWQLGEAVRR